MELTGERTLLWDAIRLAACHLEDYRQRCGSAASCRLRVLCLTDGADIGSEALPADVLAHLTSSGIILDAIVVGSVGSHMLDALGDLSGGTSHRPASWASASSLFEADGMVCFGQRQDARPGNLGGRGVVGGKLKRHERTLFLRSREEKRSREAAASAAASPASRHSAPAESTPRRPSPAESSGPGSWSGPRLAPPPQVAQPRAVALSTLIPARRIGLSDSTPARTRRLMRELCFCQTGGKHECVSVYVNDDDGASVDFWHVLIKGQAGSPYDGRWFQAYARFPAEYPMSPPEVRFVTPMIHVNINSEGRVCHGAFGTSCTRPRRT